MNTSNQNTRIKRVTDRKIVPFLWFEGNAEEAVSFYHSVFDGSKPGQILRYDQQGAEASGRPAGSIMTIEFVLEDTLFTGLNGEPAFLFNPSLSFYVVCDSAAEVERLWGKLARDGKVMMELDKYPFSEKYGWIQDRFGLSWQLIVGSSEQKISPCLMFVGDQQGRAEEALDFYSSVFSDSIILMNEHYQKGQTKMDAKVIHAELVMGGQKFILMDSGVEMPGVNFNESVSFVVHCKTQKEIDYYWEELSDGGDPSARQCGWLKDRFGLSWQVVPEELPELLGDDDRAKSRAVTEALLGMKKIDIGKLRAAYGKGK